MSRRTTARRGLKKRGILPSFGDIVLPVVSIAAVALLVLAGRQFFINGMKTSPGITSTRAFADSPAIQAEKEEREEREEKAEKLEEKLDRKLETPKSQVKQNNLVQAGSSAPKNTNAVAVPVNPAAPPVAQVKPAVSPAKPAVTQKPAPPKAAQKPQPERDQIKPIKASKLPANKQWRVQTGSYTTRAAANEAVKKIQRSGFTASVYKNPASKHYKVWVLGGESKYQAGLVLTAMKKLGYKTSFMFPPASK